MGTGIDVTPCSNWVYSEGRGGIIKSENHRIIQLLHLLGIRRFSRGGTAIRTGARILVTRLFAEHQSKRRLCHVHVQDASIGRPGNRPDHLDVDRRVPRVPVLRLQCYPRLRPAEQCCPHLFVAGLSHLSARRIKQAEALAIRGRGRS